MQNTVDSVLFPSGVEGLIALNSRPIKDQSVPSWWVTKGYFDDFIKTEKRDEALRWEFAVEANSIENIFLQISSSRQSFISPPGSDHPQRGFSFSVSGSSLVSGVLGIRFPHSIILRGKTSKICDLCNPPHTHHCSKAHWMSRSHCPSHWRGGEASKITTKYLPLILIKFCKPAQSVPNRETTAHHGRSEQTDT